MKFDFRGAGQNRHDGLRDTVRYLEHFMLNESNTLSTVRTTQLLPTSGNDLTQTDRPPVIHRSNIAIHSGPVHNDVQSFVRWRVQLLCIRPCRQFP